MKREILDEVALLFVEQFDNLHGMLTDRTDVRRIRRSADVGEAAMYSVVASVFGDQLDDVLIGASQCALEYIVYAEELWDLRYADNRSEMFETVTVHLESLRVILKMVQQNEHGCTDRIRYLLSEAEKYFQNLKERY